MFAVHGLKPVRDERVAWQKLVALQFAYVDIWTRVYLIAA